MPPVPLTASAMACSAIAAIPWRSMSFIVKTCTPDARMRSFSRSSRFLIPTSTVCCGSTDGDDSDRCELGGLLTEQRGERHAVYVPAGRRLRRVHVAVRIHPDEPQRICRDAANPVGACGDRSRSQAVIAAEHHRQRTRVERVGDGRIERLAHARDFVDVLLVLVGLMTGLGNRRRHITLVDDVRPRSVICVAESRDPKRRRSHVDAATAGAEVERHADDVDRFQLRNPQFSTSQDGLLPRVGSYVTDATQSAARAAVARPSLMQSGIPIALKPLPVTKSPGSASRRRSMLDDTLEVTDFVLRALACPAIERVKRAATRKCQASHSSSRRAVSMSSVVGSVEAAGVAAATEESAQQHVTLGRATGPLRRDPRSRQQRQAFSAWHDEAGSAERMGDLIASIAERNGCR